MSAPLRPDFWLDETALDRVTEAYRVGRVVPYEPQLISANDPHWGIVEAVQAVRVPLAERLVFQRCRRSVAEGLSRARLGKLASATQLFTEANQLIENVNRPDEIRFLGRAILRAAQAYVSYRQGQYTKARHQVLEALELDLLLENDYGYGILHLHRITLISNLARIATRAEGNESGVRPLVNILLYLEGAGAELESLTPAKSDLASLPADLIREMLFGFASDLAVLWLSLEPDPSARLLPILQPLVQERTTPRFQPAIADAFRVRAAVPNERTAQHEAALLATLTAGRRQAPRLWYALVVDLVRLLAGRQAAPACALRAEIAKDAAQWPDLPVTLRPELLAIS